MTAVPYAVDVTIHKLGIPLFFFGGIILQMIVGIRECQLKDVPRSLPMLCFAVVAIYLFFFTLEMLYQADVASRNTPVLWEWLCGISVFIWVFAHSIILGRDENSVDFPLITWKTS